MQTQQDNAPKVREPLSLEEVIHRGVLRKHSTALAKTDDQGKVEKESTITLTIELANTADSWGVVGQIVRGGGSVDVVLMPVQASLL